MKLSCVLYVLLPHILLLPWQEHSTHCLQHGANCVVNPKRDLSNRALVINTAGNECQAWSSEGKRQKHSHKSQSALLCWVAQRRELALRSQESLFFQECTPLFDIKGCLEEPLSSSHKVVHVVTGPSALGWPAARDRMLSCGLSLQELVWIGPKDEDIQEDFDSLFSRRCELSGKIFLQATQEDIASWTSSRMKKRMRVQQAVPLSGEALWSQVLTPMQMQRVKEYKGLAVERASVKDGCFIADVDHWPDSPGPSSGPYFPTLLRHGTILEFSEGRVALAKDRFLSLGFQPYGHLPQKYAWPAAGFLHTLTERQLHSLSGNSQSLPSILSWYLYVLSNTIRREPFRLHPAIFGSEGGNLLCSDDQDDFCDEAHCF